MAIKDLRATSRLSGTASTTPTVDLHIVGGGGGGAAGASGGAGGGGGGGGVYYLYGYKITKGTSYTITVGAGASQRTTSNTGGFDGTGSSFADVNADGGGGGGTGLARGSYGGSSGGAGGHTTSAAIQGRIPQNGVGGPGGYDACAASGLTGAGGGGGAGGGNPFPDENNNFSGNGAFGLYHAWDDYGTAYGGGGGGGANSSTANSEGDSVAGGGGNGAAWSGSANAGNANTGGGGGGGSGNISGVAYYGAAGGSGRVQIRFPQQYGEPASTTGSPTITRSNNYYFYTWTGSGSVTF